MRDKGWDPSATFSTLLVSWDLVVPGLGSALSAAYSEYSTRGRLKRIEEALARISDLLEPTLINNEFATSPAGVQLFHEVMQKVESEHSAEKRRRFANLIVSSWIADRPTEGLFEESVLFTEATSRFSDGHLSILLALYEAGESASVSFSDLADLIVTGSQTERREMASIIIHDLCSRFVFARRAWDLNRPSDSSARPMRVLTAKGLSPEAMAWKCLHAINPRGRRYVDYVIQGPESLSLADT